jgi:hypothetical protein
MLYRLIDLVAWAKTCLLLTAATLPGSPERARTLAELQEAVVEPRRLVDEILHSGQALPQNLLVDLRASEMAIPKLEAGAVLRTSQQPKTEHPRPPGRQAASPQSRDTDEPPSAPSPPTPPSSP